MEPSEYLANLRDRTLMRRLLDGLSDDENRSLFLAGARDALPLLTGLFPFAIIVGVTGAEFGFTIVEITVMSTIVYAGASQLATIVLMAAGSHFLLVVLTAALINVRFSIYSASLAPKFQSHSRLRKAVYSFLLVDPIYALSIPRFRSHDGTRSHWYYFGGGVALWIAWILGTAIGAGMGVGVPGSFPVELIIPLVFLALLFPVLEDRPSIATAIVAGVVAVAAAPLEYNLGLLLGVSCGLLVGVFLNR